jgi:hypothetical protein
MPSVHHDFSGSTHEFLIMSLNPEYGDKDIKLGGYDIKQWSGPEAFIEFSLKNGLPFLTPIDVHVQFEATDDEMRTMAKYACGAIVNGQMSPDQDYRHRWKGSLVKTLAHIRGEEHKP